MKRPKKRSGRGFTLIELLIVVAIIGILAAIAIPNFLQAQVRAKVSRTKADHQGYALALETYRIDDTAYPPSCGVGPGDEATRYCPDYWTVYCGGVQIPLSVDRFRRLTTPIEYLTSLPTDPFSPALVPDQKYYLYYDSCELDLWIRLASRFPDTLGWVDIPRVGQWMINGAGPDNLYEVSRIFSLANPPQFLEYDPTNGTVSTGDVFRFGP